MEEYTRRLKIAYINRGDSHDTAYHIRQTLQTHCGDIHSIETPHSSYVHQANRLGNKISQLVLHKQIAYDRFVSVAREQARAVSKQLAHQQFDVLIAPATPSEIAFLHTDIPIVYVADGTFELFCTHKVDYANLLAWSYKQGNEIEIAAYQNASALLFGSEWAGRSAIADYFVEPYKVYTFPFGANLSTLPPREMAYTKKKSYRCTLLFLGRDWYSKGGDIAIETLLELEQLGIEAELIVCGTNPPENDQHERMKVIPYLDKRNERQRYELERLYRTADFLLVPARHCFDGLVYCEASAYGIPSLAAQTGGITDIIKNGENGFILPPEARGKAYAEVIAEIYNNDTLYTHLVRSSRQAFEERLNWDSWGKTACHVLQEITAYPKVLV